MYEAYKRMYEAVRIPNIDEILKAPEEAARLDPIDENMAVLYSKPIKAFPEQDHESHIAVHVQFLQDPSLGGNPEMNKAVMPIFLAHIAEHIALLYRTRMQAGINMELPALPNLRDPKFRFDDIDPELDMLISQRAAMVVQQAPQMKPIAAINPQQGQQGQENPLQYAQQLAQLEAEALKARTQAQIAADQAKAQSSIQLKQAEAQQDMQIDAAKANAELQAKVTKLQAELQMEREKNQVKLQMDQQQNQAKLQMEQQKNQTELQMEIMKDV